MPCHTLQFLSAAHLSLFILLVLADSSLAAVLHVPAEYPTIQTAIDASTNGDEVIVAPGEYVELIDFHGRAITLRSTNPADPNVILSTIINGDGNGPVVSCTSGENLSTTISGFTITGGEQVSIGRNGIQIIDSGLTIQKCSITNNNALGTAGGGLFAMRSSARIENCTFWENTDLASAGTGAACYIDQSDVEIFDCEFTANESGSSPIDIRNFSNVVLSRCRIANNVGFICVHINQHSVVTIEASSIAWNDQGNSGGSTKTVLVANVSQLSLRDTINCRNSHVEQFVVEGNSELIDLGGNVIDSTNCPPGPIRLPADFDGDVDLHDFAIFQEFFTGPI